ncbi:4-(cytidine 5'-diphospho)-2-C-methyl-D-erythritol kinase [Kaistia terrae]|uniref:4-diphosphocytidyl-2-C-methyl-D-erythritol kinase n=1 Tax=Kaistia terrae TaxID=537017 RepID=A0ABW0PXX6_9HYPH|nr:4-(cytidine 5'-diphospho)-2-C-methyl-D-erythritol kinase [Kaistia terrae]MCX5576659.1 4-(cytidine 5'-diphospho)-2-C-methyl-D-erythritol kinase [Kaistia terrae]
MLGSAFAPAKINLALHITGRRADGYHRLDSLVVFAAIGDTIEAIAAPDTTEPTLDIVGPFAAGLDSGSDNLVLRAARAHAAAGGRIDGLALRLIKRLPVASGIGGGSADAAATLRLLDTIAPLPSAGADTRLAMATRLGADVPMCLRSTPLRATGIGERIEPLRHFPTLPMVLVNPGVAVSTPSVFKRLEHADNLPLPEFPLAFADAAALAEWLIQTRNDLEAGAVGALPVIADALAALNATTGCLLARMSGSGATVFGLFADATMAKLAAERIAAQHPEWWVVATTAEGA